MKITTPVNFHGQPVTAPPAPHVVVSPTLSKSIGVKVGMPSRGQVATPAPSAAQLIQAADAAAAAALKATVPLAKPRGKA